MYLTYCWLRCHLSIPDAGARTRAGPSVASGSGLGFYMRGCRLLTWAAGQYASALWRVCIDRSVRRSCGMRSRTWQPVDAERAPSSESDAYDDIVLAANLFSQNQRASDGDRGKSDADVHRKRVPMDARLSYDLLATSFGPAALARRRGDRTERSDAERMLPSTVNEPVFDPDGNAASRRHRDQEERCDRVIVSGSEESASGLRKFRPDLTVEQLRDR